MEQLELIKLIILCSLGIPFLLYWLLLHRRFTWTFLTSTMMIGGATLSFLTEDLKGFIVFIFCFLVLGALYLYDYQVTYKESTKRGRR